MSNVATTVAVVLGREVIFTGSKRDAEKWRNAHGGMIVYAAHLKLGDKLAVAHLSREEET